MAVTIRDVARAAGCSFKTVSRVINGEPNVTDEMRARVKKAINNTGYTPNLAARRLVTKRANNLCVLFVPGVYPQDSVGLARVISTSYGQGYSLFFLPYSPLNKRSRSLLFDLVTQNSMDGFISTPPCDTDDFIQDLISTYKTPLVQIDPLRATDFPTVCGSHASGARAITQYLLSLGHRRIAFLEGPAELRSSAERLAGVRSALLEKGLPLDPGLVENGEFTFDGGVQATRRIVSVPHPPTAVIGGNDMSALGAIYALQELGIHVPGQVSVCGFDDLPQSSLVFPGLSTVHQPADELLEAAVLLLMSLLNTDHEIQPSKIIPSRLMLRGSTASPADG